MSSPSHDCTYIMPVHTLVPSFRLSLQHKPSGEEQKPAGDLSSNVSQSKSEKLALFRYREAALGA